MTKREKMKKLWFIFNYITDEIFKLERELESRPIAMQYAGENEKLHSLIFAANDLRLQVHGNLIRMEGKK